MIALKAYCYKQNVRYYLNRMTFFIILQITEITKYFLFTIGKTH